MCSLIKSVFDVFLSYSRADSEVVERLGRILADKGFRPFYDRWYLTPGQSWQTELESRLKICRSIAVCLGQQDMGSWQQREKEFALDWQAREEHSHRLFPVIPVLLPGSRDPALGFLGLNTWVDLRSGLSDHASLSALFRGIRGEPPGSPEEYPPDPRQNVCPYRGLLPFREEDAEFFFGREQFIKKLIEITGNSNLIAVIGASGSGKSSVVRAGLLPRLRTGADDYTWEILTINPGPQPLHSLMAVLSPPSPELSRTDRIASIEKDVTTLKEQRLNLRAFVDDIFREQPGTDRLLLFVDQWEELYTQTRNEDDRKCFLKLLLDVTVSGPITMVLTMRGDFFGRALKDRDFADRLQDAVVNIGPMRKDELERAIIKPAEMIGLSLEEGLVSRILEDVGDEPGNLPLAEFLLQELWKMRTRPGFLIHKSYEDVGGVKGVIASRAENEMAKLSLEEREIARRIFVRLVTPGEGREDTRARTTLPKDKAALDIVQQLADARLLVTNWDDSLGLDMVELGHEALIREWEDLRHWVNENREVLRVVERIKADMSEWRNKDKDTSLLLPSGRRLEEARELLENAGDVSIVDIIPYIDASIVHDDERRAEEKRKEDEERQRELEAAQHLADTKAKAAKRIGITAMAALLLAIIATGTGVYGWFKKNEAQKQAIIAEFQSRIAEARGLLAIAQVQEGINTECAVNIALEAATTAKELDINFYPFTDVVRRSLANSRVVSTIRASQTMIDRITFSVDGQRIAYVDDDIRQVVVVQADLSPGRWNIPLSNALSVDWHPNQDTLAITTRDGDLVLWDVVQNAEIDRISVDPTHQLQPMWNPSGESILLFTVYNPGTRFLFEPESEKLTRLSGPSHGGSILAVWSPDETQFASIEGLGLRDIYIWSADGTQVEKVLRGHTAGVTGVAWHPEGQILAAGLDNGEVWLWNTESEMMVNILHGHHNQVFGLDWIMNGNLLISGSWDGTVKVWRKAGSWREIETMTGHMSGIRFLASTPDKDRFISVGQDGVIKVWRPLISEEPRVIHQDNRWIWDVAWSPVGEFVASASDKSGVLISHPDGGNLKSLGSGIPVTRVSWQPGKPVVASASLNGVINLWDASTGNLIHSYPVLQSYPSALDWSRDGRFLAISYPMKMIVVLVDVEQDGKIQELRGVMATSLAFSPNADRLAIDNSVLANDLVLFDLTTQEVLDVHFEGIKPNNAIWGMDWSPDGRYLAIASDDDTAIIWNASIGGKPIKVLMGHQSDVKAVAWRPDGEVLATASLDGTVKTWAFPSGRPIETLPGHNYGARGVSWNPNGTFLATASEDGKTRIFNMDTDALIGRAKKQVLIGLTQEERSKCLEQSQTIKLQN